MKIYLLTYPYCKYITKWQKRAVLFDLCSCSWGVSEFVLQKLDLFRHRAQGLLPIPVRNFERTPLNPCVANIISSAPMYIFIYH